MIEESDEVLSFNVTRCRYAELYESLGIREIGTSFSCTRDLALIEGFNPDIALERTQTIMEGAPHCDFRYRIKYTLQKGRQLPCRRLYTWCRPHI